MLFSFQGKIWLATRTSAGKFEKQVWVGNAPTLQLQMSTENATMMESYSGNRNQIGDLDLGKTATVNMTLTDWTPENLALGFYGEQVDLPTDTVTDEALPTSIVAGDVIRLDSNFVSDVVLEANATPLVEGTDYRIESAAAGLIEFLADQADPVTADYSAAAANAVTMFTTRPQERWLLLDGINTDNNEPVVLELYRVKFRPFGDTNLITNEYGELTLEGSALFDQLNAANSNLGGFGRTLQQADA